MSAKRTRQAVTGSSFLHRFSDGRLRTFFEGTRSLVSSKFPNLSGASLGLDCREILAFRWKNPGYIGQRSLMHAGHRVRGICAVRLAAGLSDAHLAGLMLHEFGHLGGGDSEPEANRWVLKNFGIEVEYKGPLDIQWVDPEAVRRVLSYSSSAPS